MFNKYIIILLIILIASCKKDSGVSTTPAITFVSVSSNSIQSLTDSLIFTIHYKDGDGDLGENNTDVKNLFLIDNRIPITYQYRIQQLAPTGSTISIEGNLNVVLKGIAITDSSSSQNATFSIYVKDRAGHQSNTVTSGAVTIHQ